MKAYRRYTSTLALAISMLASLFHVSAQAEQPPAASPPGQITLNFSTGGNKGAYFAFIKEVSGVCGGNAYKVTAEVSSGSSENVERMLANEVVGAPIQLDVAENYKATRDLSGLRPLMALFPEQAHFVTRAELGEKEATEVFGRKIQIGSWKFDAKPVVLNTIEDLAGRNVAAAGGSYYTGMMMRHPTVGGLPMNLKELTGPSAANDAIAGVLTGEYAAAIMVTAQPAKLITELGENASKLKLLPVSDAMFSKISRFYPNKTSLSYRKMGAGGTNIPSFEVMSVLMVQNYTTGKYAVALADLRQCILDNAKELSGQPGTSLAWRHIAKNGEIKVPNWERWEMAPTAGKGPAPKLPARK